MGGVADLALQVLAEADGQTLLELPDALARDAEAVAQILERQRVFGDEALVEDGKLLVLSHERLPELRELLLEESL